MLYKNGFLVKKTDLHKNKFINMPFKIIHNHFLTK